jgi:hypothetical protein
VKGFDGDVLYFRPAFVCRAAKIVRLEKEKTKGTAVTRGRKRKAELDHE